MPIIWFSVLGIYIALINLKLDPNLSQVIVQGLIILLMLSVLLVLARITNRGITVIADRMEGTLISSTIVINITNFIYLMLALLIIIESLGINVTPLITLLGIGGLTVALALQQTLSNFFAEIYIVASREFKMDDYIKLDSGEEGYITDMNWRHAIIRPPTNIDIVIPNSRLASAVVTNFGTHHNEIALTIQIGISYESDLDFVETVTNEVALETIKSVQGVLPKNKPYIRFFNFGPSTIDFMVNLFGKKRKDITLIRHEFMKNIIKRYRKENIDMPFPTNIIITKNMK